MPSIDHSESNSSKHKRLFDNFDPLFTSKPCKRLCSSQNIRLGASSAAAGWPERSKQNSGETIGIETNDNGFQ